MKMLSNVAITLLLYLVQVNEAAPAPIRLTIDCGVDETNRNILGATKVKIDTLLKSSEEFDVDTFCESIHKIVPKAVKDGKFVLVGRERDQLSQSNTVNAVSVSAPRRPPITKYSSRRLDIPRLKLPNLSTRKVNLSKLKDTRTDFADLVAPSIGSAASFPIRRRDSEDDSSAEKMERLKKGIQKMLHFVKVLGQIDEYLSERTRILIDKLSKMFAD